LIAGLSSTLIRNANNIMPAPARTTFHVNGFLPSTVNLWSLLLKIKQFYILF